jgi:phosphinothricin acetyltransferase
VGGLLRGAGPLRDHCRWDIRPAEPENAAAIAAIYNHYVATTCITFETDAVSAIDMGERIAETRATNLPWLLAQANGQVLGYAYASKWKGRCAYRHSVESTVYLDAAKTGQGIGKPLYAALIDALRARAMHAVIGGIALPNDASIALHERMGFEKVAHFKQVGFKQERWIDVGYWQLLLQ